MINQVNSRVTFKEVEAYMATAKYTSPENVTAPPTIVLVDEEEFLQKEIESFSPTPTTKPVVIIPHSVLLHLDDITLTCDDLKTAGRSAAMIRSDDIGRMNKTEVADCLEVFGNMNLLESYRPEIWAAIRKKLYPDGTKITGGEMINLNKLLGEVARFNPQYLNLDQSNIDAISVLGKHSDLLIHEYLKVNNKVVLNELELASLGRMLCGLTADEWLSYVNRQTFTKVLMPSLARLNCMADEKVKYKRTLVKSLLFNVAFLGSCFAVYLHQTFFNRI